MSKSFPKVVVVSLALLLGCVTASAFAQTATRSSTNNEELKSPKIGFQLKSDRVDIHLGEKSVGEFVFNDTEILRPYFSNLRSITGEKVTRNHPPISGQDAVDHATMHPGIWLAFGSLNGQDFWRNKAAIQHERFIRQPVVEAGVLGFATESKLVTGDGTKLGNLVSKIEIRNSASGIWIVWNAQLSPLNEPLDFGDQEEMGFGIRVETALTEKNGGVIQSSTEIAGSNATGAKATWGQAAKWCDYSGKKNGQQLGITVMASPKNFRPSWWHNRDYGLMVANPFGRAAMKQGETSSVIVAKGEVLELEFAALIHDGKDYSAQVAYDEYATKLQKK